MAVSCHNIFGAMRGSYLIILGVAAFSIGAFLSDTTATQYGASSVSSRLDHMERTVEHMQRQLYRTSPDIKLDAKKKEEGASSVGSQALSADVELRLSTIDDQLRLLTGRLEKVEFMYGQLIERLQHLESVRMKEKTSSSVSNKVKIPKVPSSNISSTPLKEKKKKDSSYLLSTDAIETELKEEKAYVPTAQEQYDHAFRLLRRSRFGETRIAFQDFLKDNPQHKLVGNAHYWMGETYFIQQSYEKAAIQFLKGYKKFPTGDKAPDNLLKLGISLGKLKKRKEACSTFDKLYDEFPNASTSIRQRAREESARVGCR